MSVTSSMWASVSGLLAHGERMSVIGNNIANVNTVGFKGSRMDFEDFAQMSISSGSNTAQVGRGVGVSAVFGDFSQGSFETSNEATDMAISGSGFFGVSPLNSEEMYYTRAGNFRFNSDYVLVDPNGYAVQGWEIERTKPTLLAANTQLSTSVSAIQGSGVPKDVALDGLICSPMHTTNITMNPNLSANSGNDKSVDETDPFFALLKKWDASSVNGVIDPLSDQAYAYQESIKVYDESGVAHTITVYFDQVSNSETQELDNNNSSQRHWEFIVTMNPEEDVRNFKEFPDPLPEPFEPGADYDDYNIDPKSRGLLMAGTLTFDTGGNLIDMSAFVPGSGVTPGATINNPDYVGTTAQTNPQYMYEPIENPSYVPGTPSTNPMYITDAAGNIVYNDAYNPNGPYADTDNWQYIPNPNNNIVTNPGYDASQPSNNAQFLTNPQGTSLPLTNWVPAPISNNGFPMFVANFSGIPGASTVYSTNPSAGSPQGELNPHAEPYLMEFNFGLRNTTGLWDNAPLNAAEVGNDVNSMMGVGLGKELLNSSAKSASGSSSMTFMSQNGYTFGYLQNVSVDSNGVLSGRYSNGQTLELYQLALYTFPSNQGLYREGGNLFSQTRESGEALLGAANTNGKGSILSNSLEISNVDLAKEFVNMITTQRGFQANSKTVTTVDSMLETIIGMKR